MTAEAATENSPGRAIPRPRYTRRRQPFGGHVAAEIDDLQTEYLKQKPNSVAVAALARLRSAAGKTPGDDYTILTYTQVPERYLGERPGDEPTDTERAKHAALTLYAVHQQSIRDTPMHSDGFGLGAAISLLSKAASSEEAVRRRFAALGTASTYEEALHHLRALIRLLREHRIALDYGLLADDLVRLQHAAGRARVRALWGREFYRMPDGSPDDPEKSPAATASPNNDRKE